MATTTTLSPVSSAPAPTTTATNGPSSSPTTQDHAMDTRPERSEGTREGAGGTRPTRVLSINEADEDVLMAVRALGDMRNQRVSPPSSTTSHALASPTSPDRRSDPSTAPPAGTAPTEQAQGQQQGDFVSRVSSHFPIVNTALRAYESSKNSSRVVKIGAEMVESSIATLSRPVMDRLPVAQMDGFACRQLDKLQARSRSYSGSHPSAGAGAPASDEQPRDWEVNTPSSMKALYTAGDNGSTMSLDTQDTYSSDALPPLSPSTTRDTAPAAAVASRDMDMSAPQQSRAGWQTMLVGAGGLSAAVSDENMRRLQLCLEWLRWATRITDQHINILRNFLASLSMPPPNPESTPISPASARTLAEAQSGVVDAIKKVVNIVSSYAGTALPDPARAAVRKWILELPERWRAATLAHERERNLNPQHHQTLMTPEGQLPSYTTAKTMAHKVLALALESLDMLRAVTGVFMDSLQSAENWLDRFGRPRPGAPPPALPSSTFSSGTTTPTIGQHPPHGAYWPTGPGGQDLKSDPYAAAGQQGYYAYGSAPGHVDYGYEKGREGR